MTHSPAPWRYDRDNTSGYGEPLLILDKDGNRVIAFGDSYLNDVTEPSPSDAALIAAAPELLEACKTVLEAFKDLPTNDAWYAEIALLESAIAKAEPK